MFYSTDKPGKAQLTLISGDDYVLHGAQAVLECRIVDQGNPPAHSIHWTHNGVRLNAGKSLEEPVIDNRLTLPGSPGQLVARYRTALADMTTAGQYACAAISELGEGQWALMKLEVKSPPKLVQALPHTLGAQLNQSFSLTCRIECEPLCKIHWYHNNLTHLSPDSRGVFSSTIRNELRAKLRNGNELAFWIETSEHQSSSPTAGSIRGYSFTVSKLHIVNSSALFDHDQLSCVSAGNKYGSPVQSSVVFRRECKSL